MLLAGLSDKLGNFNGRINNPKRAESLGGRRCNVQMPKNSKDQVFVEFFFSNSIDLTQLVVRVRRKARNVNPIK